MSADADMLDRLIVTITSVRRRFGSRAYRAAIGEARLAVAALVLREAERRAGVEVVGRADGSVVSMVAEARRRRGHQDVDKA